MEEIGTMVECSKIPTFSRILEVFLKKVVFFELFPNPRKSLEHSYFFWNVVEWYRIVEKKTEDCRIFQDTEKRVRKGVRMFYAKNSITIDEGNQFHFLRFRSIFFYFVPEIVHHEISIKIKVKIQRHENKKILTHFFCRTFSG